MLALELPLADFLSRISMNFIASHTSGRSMGVVCEDISLGNQEIFPIEERKQLDSIFGQITVTRLLQQEVVLDDVKKRLCFCPLDGLEFPDLLIDQPNRRFWQGTAIALSNGDTPPDGGPLFSWLLDRRIRRQSLFAVWQCMGLHGIVRVDNAELGIGTNVCPHDEVALIALLRLMAAWIAFPFLIFRRGDTRNVGCIDNALLAQLSFSCQIDVLGISDVLSQLKLLPQPSELEASCGIRSGCFTWMVDRDKSTNGLAIVESVFDALVREAEALAGFMHAQPAFQSDRRSASSFARGGRLNLRHQGLRWRDRVKKPVAPRHLLLGHIFKFRKARLHRHVTVNNTRANSCMLSMPSVGEISNKSVFLLIDIVFPIESKFDSRPSRVKTKTIQ